MFYTRALQIGLVLVSINNLHWLFDLPAWLVPQFHTSLHPSASTRYAPQVEPASADYVRPLRRRHVAIATAFKYHAEVYSPFAWTVAKIFEKQLWPSSVHIYDEETEFVSLMQRLGLLPENILRSPAKGRFIADVRSTTLFPDDPGAMIDLIVLVTCERE